MNLNLILSLLVTAGGAFLAYDSSTPVSVRIAGAVVAALSSIHQVAQNHATARNTDRVAGSLGRAPVAAPSPSEVAKIATSVMRDLTGQPPQVAPPAPPVAAPPTG